MHSGAQLSNLLRKEAIVISWNSSRSLSQHSQHSPVNGNFRKQWYIDLFSTLPLSFPYFVQACASHVQLNTRPSRVSACNIERTRLPQSFGELGQLQTWETVTSGVVIDTHLSSEHTHVIENTHTYQWTSLQTTSIISWKSTRPDFSRVHWKTWEGLGTRLAFSYWWKHIEWGIDMRRAHGKQ